MATLGAALAEAHRIAWEDPAPEWFAPARQTVEALGATEAATIPGPGLNAPWRVVHHLRTGFALWARWLAGEPADPAITEQAMSGPVADPTPAAWQALIAGAIADEGPAGSRRGHDGRQLLAVVPRYGSAAGARLSFIAHTGYPAGELRTLASMASAG